MPFDLYNQTLIFSEKQAGIWYYYFLKANIEQKGESDIIMLHFLHRVFDSLVSSYYCLIIQVQNPAVIYLSVFDGT